MKIKKGDTVIIISGKDRGKKSKVNEVLPKSNKIIVEGVNIVKKHRRPRSEREKGQVIEVSQPINISNVKLFCPKCSKATRVGYRVADKNKYRVCKKCKQEI